MNTELITTGTSQGTIKKTTVAKSASTVIRYAIVAAFVLTLIIAGQPIAAALVGIAYVSYVQVVKFGAELHAGIAAAQFGLTNEEIYEDLWD